MSESLESIINETNKNLNQDKLFSDMARVNLANVRRNLVNGVSVDFYTKRLVRVAQDPAAQANETEDTCETCGSKTYFTVLVLGRRAYWCGCDNTIGGSNV